MRGISIIGFGLVLAVAACGPPPKPKWSPYAPPRSEAWHSGKALIANYDSDGDGTVTRRELEAGLRQYFRLADTNGDGRLDPDEVAAANQRRMREDQSTAIPLIDWNEDGFVDFNEFANGVRSEFEELDLNGDGQVTLEEFRRGS
jgi:Ca2+-binding EF-hand superfamily protein